MQGACRLIDDRHELGRHAAERSGPVISPPGLGVCAVVWQNPLHPLSQGLHCLTPDGGEVVRPTMSALLRTGG